MGVRPGSLSFNYLSVLLFKGQPTSFALKRIADKILQHFEAWKGKLLSYAGKACLLFTLLWCIAGRPLLLIL